MTHPRTLSRRFLGNGVPPEDAPSLVIKSGPTMDQPRILNPSFPRPFIERKVRTPKYWQGDHQAERTREVESPCVTYIQFGDNDKHWVPRSAHTRNSQRQLKSPYTRPQTRQVRRKSVSTFTWRFFCEADDQLGCLSRTQEIQERKPRISYHTTPR